MHQIIFEGDKAVVSAMISKEESNSELYPMIRDIQMMISLQLSWRVQFNIRETDNIAHHLAKLAFTMQEDSI